MGRDEVGTHAALGNREDHRPDLAVHRGRIVKLMGDGLLADFPSVVEALTALSDPARPARAQRRRAADRRIDFRIGINLGDVITEARTSSAMASTSPPPESLADPGGIVVSGPPTISQEQARAGLRVPRRAPGQERRRSRRVFRVGLVGACFRRRNRGGSKRLAGPGSRPRLSCSPAAAGGFAPWQSEREQGPGAVG